MNDAEAKVVLFCLRAELFRRAGATVPKDGLEAAWRSLHASAPSQGDAGLAQLPSASDLDLAHAVFERAQALSQARRDCPPGAWFDGSLSLLEQAVEAATNSLWSVYAARALEPDAALRLGMLPLAQWEWMQDIALGAEAWLEAQPPRSLLESPLATLWLRD